MIFMGSGALMDNYLTVGSYRNIKKGTSPHLA